MNQFVCSNSGEIFIYLDEIKRCFGQIRTRAYVLISAFLVFQITSHLCF